MNLLLVLAVMLLRFISTGGLRLLMNSDAVRKMRYSIRLARRADISEIDRCNRRNLPENYNELFYDDHLKRWPDLSLIAESEDNEMMGYALGRVELAPRNKAVIFDAFEKPEYVGHVTSLAVNDQYRGLGVARNLMEQLHASFSLYYKVDNVSLFCRVSNSAAVQLYSKVFNYEFNNLVRNYYQDEDAWYMKLTGLLSMYRADSDSELVQHLVQGRSVSPIKKEGTVFGSAARCLIANAVKGREEDQRRRNLVRLITTGGKAVMRQ